MELRTAKARAQGSLEAVICIMLVNRKCDLAQPEKLWERLAASYDAVERANADILEYCGAR